MSGDVYVIPVGGLGNRLLAVLSAVSLARKRNGKFFIAWTADDECYCQFSDLFEADMLIERSQLENMPSFDRSYSAYEGRQSGNPLCHIDRDNSVAIFSNTVFLSDDEVRHRFRHEGSQLFNFADDLHALRMLSAIKAGVKDFVDSTGTLEKSVGIHIRRGYRDEKFNTSWFDTISLKFYEDIAEAALRAGFSIHVCSDDESVASSFARKYSASVFPVRSREKGAEASAIQDALKDMLVMSKCKYIVSLYGSTFGYLSAVLGRTSLICIKGHVSTSMKLDAAINFGRYNKMARASIEKHAIIL